MNEIVKKLALVKNLDQLPNKILVNGRNIQLDKNLINIQNENGNELLFSVTNPICGVVTSQDTLVVFSTDNNLISEIGKYKEGVGYETIIIGNFGFKTDYILSGVIDYNIKGEMIVGWTDRVNPIGLLNIDNLPFTLPISKIATAKEINLCLLFPDVIVPDISITKVINGGNMKSGSVQLAVTYVLSNGDYVNWLNISNPTPIGIVNPYMEYKYTAGGRYDITIKNKSYDAIQEQDLIEVSKSIVATISNLDNRYSKLKVAAIHKHRLGVFVYEVGDYDITNKSEIDIVYSGNTVGDLSLDEISTNSATFDKCDAITLVGGRLLLGNVTISNVIDFQPFANAIKVGYKLESLNFIGNDPIMMLNGRRTKSIYCHIDAVQATNQRSLMPDEVYALYVAPIFIDGSIGQACHIPGREADYLTLVNAKENELLSSDEFDDLAFSSPYIKTSRTLSPNIRFFHNRDTSTKSPYNGQTYNKLSYWENEDEVYPDHDSFLVKEVDVNGNPITVGTLKGSKVRHHKMPSMISMYAPNEPINKSIYLEFKNINIPKDIHAKLQGLRFYYAERSNENMTILGEYPLVMNGFPNENRVSYPYGYMTNAEYTLQYQHNLRFNDYNLLTTKPSLTASYLKIQYESFNDVEGLISPSIRKDMNLSMPGTYPTLENTWTYCYNKYSAVLNEILPIESIKYQPNDNAATVPSNVGRESTVSIKIPDSVNMTPYISNHYYKSQICTLNKLMFNVYTDFTNQKLVTTNHILRLLPNVYKYEVSSIKGFDTFINSYRTLMYRGDRSVTDPDTLDISRGMGYPISAIFNEFKFVSYSIFNTPYRIDSNLGILDDKYTKNTLFIWNKDNAYRTTNFNVDPSIEVLPKYYLEYSAINNIKAILKYNVNDTFIEHIPHRIARSNITNKESVNIAWRLFSPLDYYDMIKNKGEIVSLKSIGNGVMIQMKYGLYKAIVKDKLMTLDTETYLGTGELFDREPDELLPTDKGYIGCVSPLSIILDEIGYFVIDAEAKRAFIINNSSVKELTSQLVKDEFERLLDSSMPPVGQRICSAFDPLNHKLLISNHLNVPFTLSYYDGGEELGFLSKHDYIPFLFATTRTNLYSISTYNKNFVYKHNANNKGSYYGSKYPSVISILFNLGQEFCLNNIAINSSVIKNSIKYQETISKLAIYNQFQSSGNITISVFNNIEDYTKIRNIGNTWYYNYFRDLLIDQTLPCINVDGEIIEENVNNDKEWFDQSHFISNLVVIRMEFNNDTDKEFTLNDVNINADEFKR